jgi:hypothetical protein
MGLGGILLSFHPVFGEGRVGSFLWHRTTRDK